MLGQAFWRNLKFIDQTTARPYKTSQGQIVPSSDPFSQFLTSFPQLDLTGVKFSRWSAAANLLITRYLIQDPGWLLLDQLVLAFILLKIEDSIEILLSIPRARVGNPIRVLQGWTYAKVSFGKLKLQMKVFQYDLFVKGNFCLICIT